jgi:hypothetical protein
MTLAEYKKISDAVNADLRAALAKHGLNMGTVSGSIDATLGEVRLRILATDSAMGEPPEAIRYKQLCRLYDFHPDWLDKTLNFLNGPHILRGMLDRRSEKCILIENSKGRRMVCTPEQLRRVAKMSGLAPVVAAELGQ